VKFDASSILRSTLPAVTWAAMIRPGALPCSTHLFDETDCVEGVGSFSATAMPHAGSHEETDHFEARAGFGLSVSTAL
jgi:hypothetical protein